MKRVAILFFTLAMTNISYADSNFYLDFTGGYDFSIQNAVVTNNSNRLSFAGNEIDGLYQLQDVTWKNNYDGGFDGAVAFGFKFHHWRWDFEFLYQNIQRNLDGSFDLVQLDPSGGDTYAANYTGFPHSENRLWVYSLLLNAYYDFKIDVKWNPFIGGGIGAAWVNSESTSESSNVVVNNTTDDTTIGIPFIAKSPTISGVPFAWQIKGGLAYIVNEHLSVIGQYRLFGTTSLSSGSSTITANPNTVSPTTFYVQGQEMKGLLLNAVELGLRYVF